MFLNNSFHANLFLFFLILLNKDKNKNKNKWPIQTEKKFLLQLKKCITNYFHKIKLI